jgi:Flp pilus assembly protein TadG
VSKSGERGSEVIEAGFIVVLMFSMILLLMNITFGIFTKATLQNAVRLAVRYGITEPVSTNLNDSIASVVQQESLGLLSDTSRVQVCFYDGSGNSQTSPSAGNILQVAVTGYPFSFVTSPVLMTVVASDVMEQCSGNCPTLDAGTNNPSSSCPSVNNF